MDPSSRQLLTENRLPCLEGPMALQSTGRHSTVGWPLRNRTQGLDDNSTSAATRNALDYHTGMLFARNVILYRMFSTRFSVKYRWSVETDRPSAGCVPTDRQAPQPSQLPAIGRQPTGIGIWDMHGIRPSPFVRRRQQPESRKTPVIRCLASVVPLALLPASACGRHLTSSCFEESACGSRSPL